MYVLKFRKECPEIMQETFYDEVVVVRNGIALCNGEHVKNALEGMNYDYVGKIKDEKSLNSLLTKADKDKENLDFSLEVQKHTIKINDIPLPKERTEQPEQFVPYLENLE